MFARWAFDTPQLAAGYRKPFMISRQSFIKTLKHEETHLSNYQTFDDVSRRLAHFIEDLRKKQ